MTPALSAVVEPRRVLPFAAAFYTLFCAAGLVPASCASCVTATAGVLLVCSALLGLAGAALWLAQGVVMTTNSPQRYVDESESSFVLPPALAQEGAGSEQASEILQKALETAADSYAKLVDALGDVIPRDRFDSATDRRKAIRQAARSVLPNATETKIFVTANVRAWRHFIEMRGAVYADWEIRAVALQILDLLQEEAPLLFGDFEVAELPDGTRTATPEFSKV